MGCSWIVWLFALVILKPEAGDSFEINHLQRMLLTQKEMENKMAKCILTIVDEIDNRFTENIEINIEANSPIIKQEFLNTVEEFIANNNKSTYQFISNKSENHKTYFRVFFMESLKSLKNSIREQYHKLAPKDNFYLLIIFPKGIPDIWLVLKSIFDLFWKLSIINVNALTEDQNGIITLYTYFPFKEHRCKDTSPQVINRYINGSFTLKTSHFPEKSNNFWNCQINVGAFEYPPFIYIKAEKITGFDGLVLEQLADHLNFSVKLIISANGKVLDNRTFTGGFKLLNEGIVDLIIGDSICTENRTQYFASSHYNTYYKHLFFRTDLAASSLKTLTLPFDLYTWLVILGLSIYKYFLRSVWNKMFQRIQHQKASYNWLIIGPYIVSFLIIRSLYEGSIFKILHNRPIGIRPNSLDEAIQQGYKFMTTPQSYKFHYIIPELKKHIIVVNSKDLTETFFQTEGKYAFLASKAHMALYSKGRIFFMAQKPLMATRTCMYTPKLSYLAREFNKLIDNLRAHGHMKRIDDIFTNIKPSSMKQSNHSKEYFSLKQLLGTFHLYCVLILMSSLIFILEMLSKRNRRLKIAFEVLEKKMNI